MPDWIGGSQALLDIGVLVLIFILGVAWWYGVGWRDVWEFVKSGGRLV